MRRTLLAIMALFGLLVAAVVPVAVPVMAQGEVHSTLAISPAPTSLPLGGGTVTLTVTETNDGFVIMSGISVSVTGTNGFASGPLTASNTSNKSLNTDSNLDLNETWTWTITGVSVATSTTFNGVAFGNFDRGASDAPVENAQITVPVGSSPTSLSASSNLGIGLMIAGFAGALVFLILRRRQSLKQLA